jgi:hypothetical protein
MSLFLGRSSTGLRFKGARHTDALRHERPQETQEYHGVGFESFGAME